MPGGWRREAWTSRISNDKLAAKLGLCQHVLPESDRNDGLAHLPFISGKFSLHPVYYELAGICLIVFASATQLAEIKALLLLRTKHCTSLQGRRRVLLPACPRTARREGVKDDTQLHEASPPCSHKPPEIQSPNAAKKSPFPLSAEGAWATHVISQALLSNCFRSQGMGCPSPG